MQLSGKGHLEIFLENIGGSFENPICHFTDILTGIHILADR